jgi:hypothetical protein
MSNELNKLFYQTVINDAIFKSETGGTAQDPRLYRFKTPVKLTVSDSRPAYGIYRLMGTGHVRGSAKIDQGQEDDHTYSLELYAKSDSMVHTIAHEIHELFKEANFFTENLRVGYTWATRGTIDFDEGRQLYYETMAAFFTKVIKLIA